MKSQEQREEKEKANKAGAVIIAVVIVVLLAFAAYKTGVIPGFGSGNEMATQLKADAESLKGNNIQNRLVQYFQSDKVNKSLPDAQKAKIKADIDQLTASGALSFDYSDIQTSSGDGKGTITIIEPKLDVTAKGNDKGSAEVTVPKLIVSESVADKNDYFFHSEGDVALYTMATGVKTKVLAISTEASENEVKFDDGGNLVFSKSTAKNLKFIEGHGDTVVATIGDVSTEISQTSQGAKVDSYARMSYKNIVPGDMIKAMIGAIDPLAINLDYKYKGDNLGGYFNEMVKSQQGEPDANVKPFDGDMKLNDLSIMMGDAGLAAKADLQFKKENAKAIPYGTINFKIAQYQKLIDYFNKFIRIPQAQIDNSIKFLSEIGKNEGGNITIDVKLDGTDNAIIGGKTVAQVKEIEGKYYPNAATPKTPAITSPDSVDAAPAAPVAGKPIAEDGTKI